MKRNKEWCAWIGVHVTSLGEDGGYAETQNTRAGTDGFRVLSLATAGNSRGNRLRMNPLGLEQSV